MDSSWPQSIEMGCISRALLCLIIIIPRLTESTPLAKPTEVHRSGNVIDNTISILEKFIDDLDRPQSKDIFTRVFNLLDDLAFEVSRVDRDNVFLQLRDMALKHLMKAKEQISSISQSLEKAWKSVDETIADAQYVKPLQMDDKHFQNISRLSSIACNVIDDLIVLSTTELQNCCNITMRPSISVCRSLQTFLVNGSEFMSEMTGMFNRIRNCLKNHKWVDEPVTECLEIAVNETKNIIQDLEQKIQKMKRLLRVKFLYSRCCISMVLVEGDGE